MTTKTFEQAAEEVRDIMEAAYEEHDGLWLGGCVWRSDKEAYQVIEPKKTYLTLDDSLDGIYQDDDGNWFLEGDSYAEMLSDYYTEKGHEYAQEHFPEFHTTELVNAAKELGWKN